MNFRFFLFLIPVFLIIFSWFSTGKIISNNSEENLNILSPKKTAESYSTSLYPIATGFVIPLLIPRYPTFSFLSYFQDLGFPPFLIQALFLGIIMLVGIMAMYLLINKGFEMVWQVAIIGSLFYLLNLYSMTQIWKRFLYNGMISWAYLPLFLCLWIKSFTPNSLKWPILFLITSPIFSYTFGHPAYFFTFWIPAGIFLIFQIFHFKLKKLDILKLIFRSIVIFFLWILVNIWWLYPLFKGGGSYITESVPNWQANFDSLRGVSRHFALSDILLLRQTAYFVKESLLSSEWFDFYNHPLVFAISIIILFYFLFGVIKSRKQKYWGYLSSLLAIGLFISKGSNFPLGHTFFYWLFRIFPASAALRNPYEKFGIVYLLSYSIFFAFGFYFMIRRLKSRWRYLFTSFLAILFFGVLVYPMWNGDIFPPKDRITIPTDYIDANNYLKNQMTSAIPNRVFHIPFLLQLETLRYSWGYRGEEPSANLFELEPASQLGAPIYNLFYQAFSKHLEDEKFPRILGLIGVQNIILHKDSIYPKIDVDKTKKIIGEWHGMQSNKEFNLLVIYSLDQELIKPRIFTANSFIVVQSQEEGISKILDGTIDYKNTVFILSEAKNSLLRETQKNLPISDLGSSNISFNKKSNSSYSVHVKDARTPFILVLNNAFDNAWQARTESTVFDKHFIANGFANGWLVEKKGIYDIDIKLKIWPWD